MTQQPHTSTAAPVVLVLPAPNPHGAWHSPDDTEVYVDLVYPDSDGPDGDVPTGVRIDPGIVLADPEEIDDLERYALALVAAVHHYRTETTHA